MKLTTSLFLLVLFFCANGKAQNKTKSFEYKKGEVLDIIILSQEENSGKLFERYKETAFPVAFEYSYRPQPGFGITKLTLGTNAPKGFIFGKWDNMERRKGFLANISNRVPDFHQQRRTLFPYFGLTYFEVPKDLSFSIDSNSYNVVTSFWKTSNAAQAQLIAAWEKDVVATGGKIVVKLRNGESPTGYYYNPDILYIASWPSESAFGQFTKSYNLEAFNAFENVHQFVIN